MVQVEMMGQASASESFVLSPHVNVGVISK